MDMKAESQAQIVEPSPCHSQAGGGKGNDGDEDDDDVGDDDDGNDGDDDDVDVDDDGILFRCGLRAYLKFGLIQTVVLFKRRCIYSDNI